MDRGSNAEQLRAEYRYQEASNRSMRMADYVTYDSNKTKPTLGNDAWANECRMKIREGLRSRNMVEYGFRRYWIVESDVIITDTDNLSPLRVACKNKAEAIERLTNIIGQVELGFSLQDILGIDDIPAELL